MDHVDTAIKVKTTELLKEIGWYLCELQATLFKEEREIINYKRIENLTWISFKLKASTYQKYYKGNEQANHKLKENIHKVYI